MVEIFDTNIQGAHEASMVLWQLQEHFPEVDAHVDLYDHCNTLRIVGKVDTIQVESCVRKLGFEIILVE